MNAYKLIVEGEDDSNRYNWQLLIDAINGKIIETDDKYLYIAPETGYDKQYVYKANKTDPNWSFRSTKKFYFQSDDETLFTAIKLRIWAYHDGGGY